MEHHPNSIIHWLVKKNNWNHMPDNVKKKIVSYMDIFTRTNMKLCSKSTKSLVDSVPVYFSKVRAGGHDGGNENDRFDLPDFVYWHPAAFSLDDTHVWRNGKSIKILCGEHRRCVRFKTSEDADEKFKELFMNIVTDNSVQIDNFSIRMFFDFDTMPFIPGKIRAKEVEIEVHYGEKYDFEKWLSLFAPGVEKISLEGDFYGWNIAPLKNLILNTIAGDANELEIHKSYNFEAKKVYKPYIFDEEITKFKGTKLTICGHGLLTKEGFGKLIQKWIDNDYPVGTSLYTDIEVLGEIEDGFDGLRGWAVSMFGDEYRGVIHMNNKKYIDFRAVVEEFRIKSMEVEVKICEVPSIREAYSRLFANSEMYKRKNWNNMPMEIKRMIVERMDIVTRARLKKCSKSDKRLVESTNIHFDKVSVDYHERQCECFTNDSSEVRSYVEHQYYHYVITIDNTIVERCGRLIRIIRNGKRTMKWLNNDAEALEVCGKMAQDILSIGRSCINLFKLQSKIVCPFTVLRCVIKAKNVEIWCENLHETFIRLIIMEPTIESLFMEGFGRIRIRASVDEFPAMINARKLHIRFTDLNDDEILKLKATDLNIHSGCVSEVGVNRLIKKFIDKDYPIGAKFTLTNRLASLLRNRAEDKFNKVLEDLDYTERLTNEDEQHSAKIRMNSRKFMRVHYEENGDYMAAIGVVEENEVDRKRRFEE